MKINRNVSIATALVLLLQGCVTTGKNTQAQILGQWQSDVGGFSLVTEYSETTVSVGSNNPVEYQLEGDRLSFNEGGNQVRIVSFPKKGQMTQVDPLTDTHHEFTRITP